MDTRDREKVEEIKKETIWAAGTLFARGKATGSTANISFRYNGKIYISASGTCFGTLKPEEFAVLDEDGSHLSGPAPSKEAPLHLMMYEKEGVEAVIHTHSFYSVLWSCLDHDNCKDIMPEYTPYLRMKLGAVGLVPYAAPGSQELFDLFRSRVKESDGFLLKNHGPIVGGKNIMAAFYAMEELEESAKIAWHFRGMEGQVERLRPL